MPHKASKDERYRRNAFNPKLNLTPTKRIAVSGAGISLSLKYVEMNRGDE